MDWADHVRGIRAEPESDGPRLVAADWLLEHGEIRGEYIVLACQLAHLASGTPEHDALERRHREIDGQNSARWIERVTHLGAQGYAWNESPLLKRGFVEAITLVGEHATSFEAICELEPIIDLTLVNCGASIYQKVAAMPALAYIRHLRLQGDHVLAYEPMLASQYLTAIERLRILSDDPTPLKALAEGSARPVDVTLTEDIPTLRRLAAAGFFAQIRHLEITELTDDGAVALADAVMPSLGWLVLAQPRLTERGMAALAGHLGSLRGLDYDGIALTPTAVPILCRALAAGNLRALRFAGITCDPLADLIESPAFANVEVLSLRGNAITPRIAEALQRTAYRGKLVSLRIGIRDVETPTDFTLDGVVIHEDVER